MISCQPRSVIVTPWECKGQYSKCGGTTQHGDVVGIAPGARIGAGHQQKYAT